MPYRKYFGYLKYLIVPFLGFASVPASGQNTWNTEFIGKAAQDGNLTNYEVYNNYLYAITRLDYEYRLVIVDISNPFRPRRLTSMFDGEINSDILRLDNYLYLVSTGGDSIIVYELSDPVSPQEVARIGLGIPISGFKRLGETHLSKLAYNWYYIIDVQNPLNPEIIFILPVWTNAQDAFISGDYIYIAGATNEHPFMHLEIFDLSDTLSPAHVYYGSVSNGTHAEIARIDDYLYFATRNYNLKIYDISAPADPVLIDSLLDGYRFNNIEATNSSYAFIIGEFDTLFVLDASDPANPTLVNSIYAQANSDQMRLYGGKLCFRSDGDIFQIYDISDPANPILDGRYIAGGSTLDVTKWQDYVCVVNSYGGFRVFDVSDPTDPFGMAYYYTPHQTHKISVDNGILAIADNEGGAMIFSLADPANPAFLSAIDSVSSVYDVYVSDTLLFFSNRGFGIVNISDPGNPAVISLYPSGYWHNDYFCIKAKENYVYTGETDDGICVYDISNPHAPVKIECFDSGYARDLYIQDDLLFAADVYDGMKIFDISYPSSPVLLSTTPPGHGFSVCAFGHYACQAYNDVQDNGIRIYDFTNPYNPVLAGTYSDFGVSTGVFAENDTVYVSAGVGGVWVLRYQAPTDVNSDDLSIIPNSLSLQNYPNPFNAATTVRFTLPESRDVILSVYDILGRRIKTLLDENLPTGIHTVTFDAAGLSSGLYFARLNSGNSVKSINMLLLR